MSRSLADLRAEPAATGGRAGLTRPDPASGKLAAMRDELRQMHRLVVLGRAAATVAHEFNNLMTPVVSYARFALDKNDVGLMKKALETTLKQSAIVTSMTDRILGLAAHETPTVEAVPVREAAQEAVACLCRDLTKDGITLTVRIDEDLKVQADAKQLQQVLFNLLINARQAIGGRSGRITIGATREDENAIAVSVRDTGCGIRAEMLDQIFEPFVTSKHGSDGRKPGGVGLGLAVCRDIIEENRGTIRAESEFGASSTFTITLPAAR